jgi:alpha-ketoglutarate-dependent taurine dioxygenase
MRPNLINRNFKEVTKFFLSPTRNLATKYISQNLQEKLAIEVKSGVVFAKNIVMPKNPFQEMDKQLNEYILKQEKFHFPINFANSQGIAQNFLDSCKKEASLGCKNSSRFLDLKQLYNDGQIDLLLGDMPSYKFGSIHDFRSLNCSKEDGFNFNISMFDIKKYISLFTFMQSFDLNSEISAATSIEAEGNSSYLPPHMDFLHEENPSKDIAFFCINSSGKVATFFISPDLIFSKLSEKSQEILQKPIFFYQKDALNRDRKNIIMKDLNSGNDSWLFPIFYKCPKNNKMKAIFECGDDPISFYDKSNEEDPSDIKAAISEAKMAFIKALQEEKSVQVNLSTRDIALFDNKALLHARVPSPKVEEGERRKLIAAALKEKFTTR